MHPLSEPHTRTCKTPSKASLYLTLREPLYSGLLTFSCGYNMEGKHSG